MIETKTRKQLNILTDNYKRNKRLSAKTQAAFITRKHLNDFVKSLPRNCDAIKICFIRFGSTRAKPDNILKAGNNSTQVSLIFVPMETINPVDWSSIEVTNANGKIRTLAICEPGKNDRNSTGLCPPKKGCK